MRVLFVSDHFVTPSEPGVLRTWQLARHLAERGDTVRVVAPRAYFPFAASGTAPRPAEPPAGVEVEWMRTPRGGTGLRARLASYAAQLWSATRATLATVARRDADVVVVGLTPSMLAIGPYLVARRRGVPVVIDERDLSLDAADALGLLPRPALWAARAVERHLHRHAAAVVAVTPGIGEMLRARGVPASRIHLVPNGFEGLPEPPAPERAAAREALRRALGWGPETTVLLYAGNLGPNHDLDAVLDALALLRDEDVVLAVMGEGGRKGSYLHRAARQGLPVRFLETRPKSEVAAVCAAADVGLLPLRDHPYFRCSLPNKVFEYLGAGLPVVLVGPEGDSSRLLDAAGAGVRLAGGDPAGLAAAIRRLVREPAARRAMGASGREHVVREWSRERFLPAFGRALDSAVAPAEGSVRPSGGPGGGSAAEVARIRATYRAYDRDPAEAGKRDLANAGLREIVRERREAVAALVRDPAGQGAAGGGRRLRVLDVGCGSGEELRRMGTLLGGRAELYGVDVLPDRVALARASDPAARVAVAGGHRLPFPDRAFDLVLLGTVLSSVLDAGMRRAIGLEALRVLAPGGRVLCYDVRYPNPWNPNTLRIGRRELRAVFPGTRIAARPITLVPPLARSLGPAAPAAYRALRAIRPLRSHYLSVITPNGHRAAGARPAGGAPDATVAAAGRPR